MKQSMWKYAKKKPPVSNAQLLCFLIKKYTNNSANNQDLMEAMHMYLVDIHSTLAAIERSLLVKRNNEIDKDEHEQG